MKKKSKILLLLVVLILVLLIILIILNLHEKNKNSNLSKNAENTTYYEETDIEKLEQMSEKQRITFYFSKYIENIENKNFEDAYNVLYSEFKNKYFDNIQKFEDYINTKYPEIISVDYISVQREGVYYIISVKIEDIFNGNNFEQKFILREYDYNNFVLSFQAE